MFFNVYAFRQTGERLVIDMGLPYDEANQRCEYEAAFIQQEQREPLTRIGDYWYASGLIPRVVMYDVKADPFLSVHYEERYRKPEWLPDIEEL